MGTKIVLKLSFEKLYIMIVTDVCAFVNAWVIALEYHIFLLTNSMTYNSTSDISKSMTYISGMNVKMGVALLRENL